ncbi:hypothetical protein RB195_012406 [Necator americanus]|uniref:CXXC-type domain-containing protein n=1 Tax=Necator americanus TaxID=51031 RepID=A0ABR1D6X8_NECAM
MNTLMQMGPMMVMEGPNGVHQAFPQPSQHIQQPPPITSSMNRSQRCGVCRGCQCKPCGQCTYCQDSPQFGGPGVKKQSCIERRCLRVLENRLQRDAPTFKARVGCNQCEDCRMPDCQICLVCLDKRFFENRYMTGAMCAKKRCNNATSIELPAQSPQSMHEFQQRQAQKRAYDQGAPPPIHFEMKRRGMEVNYGMQMAQVQSHSPQLGPPPPQALGHPQAPPGQQNARILAINPAMNYGLPAMGAPRMLPCGPPPPPPPPPLNEPAYLLPTYGHTSPTPVDFYNPKSYTFEEITPNGRNTSFRSKILYRWFRSESKKKKNLTKEMSDSEHSVTESSYRERSRRRRYVEQKQERRRKKILYTRLFLIYAVFFVVIIVSSFIVFLIMWGSDDADWFHPKCEHVCASSYLADQHPPLLIISLSGFANYYLESLRLSTLERMKFCGATAERVIPSFPLKTFPNYATIATGFYPGRHGVGSDSIFMPDDFHDLVPFTSNMTKEHLTKDPIWSLYKNTKQGKVASFFWTGPFSINSKYEQPDYHAEFDPTATDQEQLNKIVRWLKLPKSNRPNLILAHFDQGKYIGYHHKTKRQLRKVIQEIDALLGKLFMKLHKEKLLHCLNIAIVSDIGMVRSTAQMSIDTKNGARWVMEPGPSALLHLRPQSKGMGSIDAAIKMFKCRNEQLRVYTKFTQPPRWHYHNSTTSSNLILVGEDGTQITSSEVHGDNIGTYGNDFNDPTTHTIFFAMGPSIKKGVELPSIQNVEFMNLWTALLGIPAVENDGEKGVMDTIIRKKKIEKQEVIDIPDCEYTVTEDVHICGRCQKDGEDKLRVWLRECRGSAPLVKPVLSQPDLDACYMPICNEGVIQTNEGKHVSIIEVYDQNEIDIEVNCLYVTQRYHEKCPQDVPTFSQKLVPLSALPYKGVANHRVSHVIMKKKFIGTFFLPLNAYTKVVFAKRKRIISITGVAYNSTLDPKRNGLPTYVYRVLIACPDGWSENGLHCREHHKMAILSFLFPHMDRDNNCMDRNRLLLQYTARLKDIELVAGYRFQLQDVPETEIMRLRIHTPFDLW